MNVDWVREEFSDLLHDKHFVVDKTGVKTVEIIGFSFIADFDHIFGEPNKDYIGRELEWYRSQSLFVGHIPGGAPKIWQQVASVDGTINSNYGFLIWSQTNGSQYANVLKELQNNPTSRRATMIYTRPTMHSEYNYRGMSDFICTNAVNYLIRDGAIYAVVQMRSNDAWAGYRNDYAWQMHVLKMLAQDLNVDVGNIVWNASSLHIYEQQFYLIDHYRKTGETSVTRDRYKELYPNSVY